MSRTEIHIIRASQPFVILVAIVLLALSALSAQASELRRLALAENDKNRPFAQVSINGETSLALIDTGATIAMIDADFFPERDLSIEDGNAARILGIGGHHFYPTDTLPLLSAASQDWTDIRVAVNAERRFPGTLNVLPISLFDEAIVDFDFHRNQILLYDGRPKRVRRSRTARVSYFEAARLIFIPIEINGIEGAALIDTGADVSFVNPQFADMSGAIMSIEDTQRLRGADLSNQTAAVYTFRDLEFAESRIRRFKMPVLETDLFTHLGFEDQPMMVLGMDILGQSRMQVDRDRQRIVFNIPNRWESRRDDRQVGSRLYERLPF